MAGVVSAMLALRVICTAEYHRDTPEFAERGFHHLGTMQMRKYEPDRRRPAARFIDDTMFVKNGTIEIAMIRRSFRYVLRFRCACGRDPQIGEDYILDRAKQYFAANPGITRVDLDIMTL